MAGSDPAIVAGVGDPFLVCKCSVLHFFSHHLHALTTLQDNYIPLFIVHASVYTPAALLWCTKSVLLISKLQIYFFHLLLLIQSRQI